LKPPLTEGHADTHTLLSKLRLLKLTAGV